MLPTVVLALVAIIGIFLVIVAFQPPVYRVARTTTITAPPADVFAQVNDFHNWDAWSPWATLDPAAKKTFDGAAAGPGAIFAWSGNKKIGQGQMTLTDSRPHELVRINLQFIRPFPSSSTAEFTFQPEGDQTLVTWSMAGKKNFISKAFCMFMNMDKMIGGDFERGLEQLKATTETNGRLAPASGAS